MDELRDPIMAGRFNLAGMAELTEQLRRIADALERRNAPGLSGLSAAPPDELEGLYEKCVRVCRKHGASFSSWSGNDPERIGFSWAHARQGLYTGLARNPIESLVERFEQVVREAVHSREGRGPVTTLPPRLVTFDVECDHCGTSICSGHVSEAGIDTYTLSCGRKVVVADAGTKHAAFILDGVCSKEKP